MQTITIGAMDTRFFIEADRDRHPWVVLSNKFPMGLFIPCQFEDGKPDVEQVCQQIRDSQKEH